MSKLDSILQIMNKTDRCLKGKKYVIGLMNDELGGKICWTKSKSL